MYAEETSGKEDNLECRDVKLGVNNVGETLEVSKNSTTKSFNKKYKKLICSLTTKLCTYRIIYYMIIIMTIVCCYFQQLFNN